jgi:hypothetical protein
MLCYECSKAGTNREAVGLCHHCSAALCTDHACVIKDPVTTTYPLARTVVLPRRARQLLCATCLDALQQIGVRDMAAETSRECCTPVTA